MSNVYNGEYIVISQQAQYEGQTYDMYGVVHKNSSNEIDAILNNVSLCIKKSENFVKLLNAQNLSVIHLIDVYEDFFF